MVRFVHTADIHIGGEYQNELLTSLDNVIKLAEQKKAHFILISGDLFDDPFPSERAVSGVMNILSSTEIDIIISPGNHDPFLDGSVWDKEVFPENVHIFSSARPSSFELSCGANVYGRAFTSYSMGKAPHIECDDKDRLNIISLHADLSASSTDYSPLSPGDISLSGADYYALGHIHKRSAVKKAGETYYCYPGCPYPRDFGETGQKGVMYCEIDKENGVYSFEFVKLTSVRYEILSVSVNGMVSTEELLSQIVKASAEQGYSRDTCLRVVLSGECSTLVDAREILTLSGRFAHIEYEDSTTDPIDYSSLENDMTLKGELFRTLKPKLFSSDESERQIAHEALRLALCALSGESAQKLISRLI